MIDSHGHIYTDRYDEDRDEVINRAAEAGITQLLQVGCNLAESHDAVNLAQANQGIYASVGVHPHDADTVNPEVLDRLESLSHHPKVVAWGEIGLDFFYDNSPREIQMAAFEAQLQRAVKLNLPVVIHTRDAEPETLEILRRNPVPRGGQVHCFTGTANMAKSLLELGFHIGFTGIITFKKSHELRDVVAEVPMERLLIETDSPYLAPMPHRGKRNEPAFVSEVAKGVAGIHNIDVEEVVRITTANFRALYAKTNLEWLPLQGVGTAS